MKKITLYILIIIILSGCEDILYIKPTNMVSSELVKSDPVLVNAFLSKIYDDIRWQSGFDFDKFQHPATLNVVGGEQNVFAAWQAAFAAATQIIDENGAPELLEYWPYDNIRSANELIQILEEAYFDEKMVKQKSAETRFLRAFMYFELVKRYGGVPLILKPQNLNQPIEELFLPRNSEKEIYDFIAAEMDEIAYMLPSEYGEEEFGRATKWAALALKSRAMVYAGSISKYGTVQLDSILGIPVSESNSYFQKAYDASIEIIQNSHHALYNENPDPVDNYYEIFINEMNSEIIFAEVYNRELNKGHDWSMQGMADGFHAAWGSNYWMYLESFEKYQYNDGSSGKLDWTKLDGNTKFDLEEFLLNKDPRLLATLFYPEMDWQGGKIYLHSETIGTIPQNSTWPATATDRLGNKTGFLIRKRINEDVLLPANFEDESDWIVFRMAEIYLNAAESAFELGNISDATNLINEIRDRAGMPSKSNMTIEDIRNERFVELYIEEHRYWDLRRWRIAVDELDGKGFHGITLRYYIDENKYTLELKDADFGQIRTFADRNYYFPIGLSRLADNPNFVENPGY